MAGRAHCEADQGPTVFGNIGSQIGHPSETLTSVNVFECNSFHISKEIVSEFWEMSSPHGIAVNRLDQAFFPDGLNRSDLTVAYPLVPHRGPQSFIIRGGGDQRLR